MPWRATPSTSASASGWDPADPKTEPAAVQPPEGLRLPAAGPVPAVARPGKGEGVDPAQVAAVVSPLLRKRVLGPHFGVLVTDLTTGKPVYRAGAKVITPASTTKLLTSTAALESLGSMARFRTRSGGCRVGASSCWSEVATRSSPAPRRRPTSATRTARTSRPSPG